MAIESDEWSELPSGAIPATSTWLGTGGKEFYYVHGLSQSQVDQNLKQLQRCGPQFLMTVRGGRTKPFLTMAIQVTHEQEQGTHLHCLHGSQSSI